jgi:hypothetical protein
MRNNYEPFLYLQGGSQHQLIGGIEKSHACTLATENNSAKADFSRTIGTRASLVTQK